MIELDIDKGAPVSPAKAERHPLPNRRGGYTQKMCIGTQNLYLRTGEYADGKIGEIFLSIAKSGTSLQGMANCFAKAISIGLQYGIPLEEYVDAFIHTKFEPAGMVTHHESLRMAQSIVDAIFRDLAEHYLGREDLVQVPRARQIPEDTGEWGPLDDTEAIEMAEEIRAYEDTPIRSEKTVDATQIPEPLREKVRVAVIAEESRTAGAPAQLVRAERGTANTGEACSSCGNFTLRRAGTCMTCTTCGSTTGCG